jgi:hypothetical protein
MSQCPNQSRKCLPVPMAPLRIVVNHQPLRTGMRKLGHPPGDVGLCKVAAPFTLSGLVGRISTRAEILLHIRDRLSKGIDCGQGHLKR